MQEIIGDNIHSINIQKVKFTVIISHAAIT